MADEPARELPGTGRRLRRRIAAALLSLVWAGLGQLYNGSWKKALLFVVGMPLAAAVTLHMMVSVPVPRLNLLPLLLPLGLQLGALVDAIRHAGRSEVQSQPRWHNRGLVCAGLALTNPLLWVPATAVALRTTVAQAFRIPNGSMEPTIVIGDRLLVSPLAYGLRNPVTGAMAHRTRAPGRDDIVAFRYPDDRRSVFLKRVVAVAGEEIEIRETQVLIDGRPVEDRHARYLALPANAGGRDTWGPQTVPEGYVFVLGDNRDNSRDSRHFGVVPIDDVLGQAKVIYYSAVDAERAREGTRACVRWSRIGQRVH